MTIAPYYILYKANVIVFVRYLGVGGSTLFFTLQNIFANHFHFTRVPLVFTFTFVYIRIVYMFSLYLLCFFYIFQTNFTNKIVYMLDNINVINN